jgi:hypothetical protein
MVMVGAVLYPVPGFVTRAPATARVATLAAAFVPLPTKLTVGTEVYKVPPAVKVNESTARSGFAVAVVVPPVGDAAMVMVGVVV